MLKQSRERGTIKSKRERERKRGNFSMRIEKISRENFLIPLKSNERITQRNVERSGDEKEEVLTLFNITMKKKTREKEKKLKQ